MAALSRVFLFLLICWVQRCLAQDPPQSILTLNPTLINLTPNTTSTGTSVTVSCSPPGAAAGKQLFVLNIKKKPINSPESTTPTVLVEALSGMDDKAKLTPSMSGATATGSVSDRIIRLVMSKAGCSDEAMYICEGTYYNSGSVTAKSEAELKAEVAPAQLTMTVTPTAPLPPASTWKVNNTLIMSCAGPVGSVNTSGNTNVPQINWQWEYRDVSSSWSPYSGDPGDIKTDKFLTTSCYKTQRSTLTRRLTLQDSGRQYRCYIRRGLTGFDQYADTYTVGTVTSDGDTPPPNDPEPAKADVGAIVGGLFGGLIVLAVIVIVVYFLVIRPRRQRQAEEDVDGVPEKGRVKATAPPNAELGDPTLDYSQQHRRPKDKNKPSKHAGHQDGRWDDRDRDRGESSKNAEGLHYADLDLMRNPPRDERIPPVRPPRGERNPPPRGERNPAPRGERNPAPRGERNLPGQENSGGDRGNTPTEYASIRLY